jgi:hypothetical protein
MGSVSIFKTRAVEELMRKLMLLSLVVAAVLIPLAYVTPADAQATRTWVSGVGDDANPCSRTAPCKTFAGAISKTASGGEINVLDPGGFGGVTITKPITISSEGFEAGVLVSGTNAIIVNVPNATDRVVLRGLDIEGLGTGLSGVLVLTGGNVTVEKCTIDAFTDSGIRFVPTVANSQLHVSNTIIRNNGNFGANTGQGIQIQPTLAAAITIDHARLDHNVAGLRALGGSTAVTNSVSSNNVGGFIGTQSPAILNIERSLAANNTFGIVCNAGATVRLGNMSIVENGTALGGNGTCFSFKNNDIDVAVSVTPINPQ